MSQKIVNKIHILVLQQRLDWIFSARTRKEVVGALRRLRPTAEKFNPGLHAFNDAVHSQRLEAGA